MCVCVGEGGYLNENALVTGEQVYLGKFPNKPTVHSHKFSSVIDSPSDASTQVGRGT